MNKKQINYALLTLQHWLENTYAKEGDQDDEYILHLHTMLPKMRQMLESGDTEKLMRWLGFIQGVLWAYDYFTIDELREMNTKDIQ